MSLVSGIVIFLTHFTKKTKKKTQKKKTEEKKDEVMFGILKKSCF